MLLGIGHIKCHFSVEQIQWTGSFNKSFHDGDICFSYLQRLGHSMGTGHSSPISLQLLLLWFSGVIQKKKQPRSIKLEGWLAQTAFSAKSRMKSTTISHFKYFPYQTFPLVSPDNFTCVSLVCIIGALRNQEKVKTPENMKVSREAEGYRWVQMLSQKASTNCLLWFLLKNHQSKQEWVFLGWVGFLLDSSFLLYVDYSNFGIEYN